MGNRATVVFVSGDQVSPAVYLHWQGGPESVYAFLDELDRRDVRADADYECARFIGIVAEFFDQERYGNSSLGVVNGPKSTRPEDLERVQTDHGDNGFYVVNRNDRSGLTGYADLGQALIDGVVHPPAPHRTVRRFTLSGPDFRLAEWPAWKVAEEAAKAKTEPGMPGYQAITDSFKATGKQTEAEWFDQQRAEARAKDLAKLTLIQGEGNGQPERTV